MIPARPRASLHTLGCRLNQSETAILEEKLRAAGYDLVPFGEAAELGIVHTCTVTRMADAKSRKLLQKFIRTNPESFTAVIGCYAQMGADSLAAMPGVDLIVGNQEKLNVLDYVAAGKQASPVVVRDRLDREDFAIDFATAAPALSDRVNLKVQDGCDFMCSFCIIPFARGRARARDFANLLDEARALVARGAKELVLTGVNIGTYALDGRTVVDIVDALDTLPGLARIRISSIEPTTIPEALFDRMRDPNHTLAPYLHIPLQSGSNAVLTAMRRRYTREAFLDFLHAADAQVPGIGIGTDILVGFPGETEADFEDTCDLLWRSPLAYAHVFKYSERPGTASVRLDTKVAPAVMAARSARLHEISAEKSRLFAEHHVGETVEVLFEHQRGGYWTGYTGNYLRVAVRSEEYLRNEIRSVRVQAAGHEGAIGLATAYPEAANQ
jgi:threonylcarbamoyladenosine tRNA methylthiotransferase MtaB